MAKEKLNSSNDFYKLFCGASSDKVESFTIWVGVFCGNKGFRLNGEKIELMWYIIEESEKLWGGVNSKQLPLYTTKELMSRYYNSYINK